MTNAEVKQRLFELVREERSLTKELLILIGIAEERNLFLEEGYPSLFEWLVYGFGYSEPAAYRRIEAARLVRTVPSAIEKIEEGALNLTTLSKARTAMKA